MHPVNLQEYIAGGVLDFSFPQEWVKAALVLAFFSTGVVVGVFAYLNRYTHKPYFQLWTAGWVFFALWLAAAIGLEESPHEPLLVFVRRACLGGSALCMFWGSFELTGSERRTRRELAWGMVMLIVWSYIAAYRVRDPFWISTPLFLLLGAASMYTGSLYYRMRRRYSGASMLTAGFMVWGVLFILRPLFEQGASAMLTISYVVSSVLGLFIALGMVVQVLEQGREQNETLLQEFRRGMMTRQLLEQEVSVSERKYRALYDSASDAIFLVDLETLDIVESNRSAEHFLGDKPSQTERLNFTDLCPGVRGTEKSLLDNHRMFEELFGPGKEFVMLRHNGASVVCEGAATLVQYNKRPVLQLNIREITERKQLEQQLRQAEKLSALGRLVAGVAHELNNPLAVIMGYAQLLVRQESADPRWQSDLQKILRESDRAAKIVRNLLTFARPREPQMANVDLNRLIAGLLETHEAEFNAAGIEVQAQLASDVPSTVADPHQLEQVFTNLIVNAIQAVCDLDGERRIEIATHARDHTIQITVADNGAGIPAEAISKIFDPFFTTKSPGKGTGLGLSISHSIIHEHRGKIWVQSERGKGAKFFVELPLVKRLIEAPATEPPTSARPMPVPTARAHRLLVVDDEPGILEILNCALTGSGYVVDVAQNGNQALERIESNRYDAIISDLCMPGVDGELLYKRVRESNPELASKIIFVTGDTVSVKSRTFLEWTGNRWFSKPFNIGEVEKVVQNFLTPSAVSVN